MKKIIYISSFSVIFIILLFMSYFFSYKINDLMYKDKTQVILYDFDKNASKSEIQNRIQKLYDDKGISVTKYFFPDTNELLLYTNDLKIFEKVKSNVIPKGNGEYITDNLSDNSSKNIGTFKKVDPTLNIKIMNINDDKDLGNYGSYLFSFNNSNINDFKEIWKELSTYHIIQDFNLLFSFPENVILPFILFFLIFISILFRYSIKTSKELSILKLNGYSFLDISKHRIKTIFPPVIFSIITGIFIVTIIFFSISNNIQQFFEIFLIISIILLIYSLIVIIFDLLFIKYLISDKKIINNIKGKKYYFFSDLINYTIKFLCIILCFISINYGYENFVTSKNMKSNLAHWEKLKNVNNITQMYVGNNILEMETKLAPKLVSFYEDLVKYKNAFMVDASNSYNITKVIPNSKTITISPNYLNLNPIKTANGEDARNYIIYDDKTLNLLVPEYLKQYEDKIKEKSIEEFYFKKIRIENIYNESLGKELDTTSKEDLNINIIYVQGNQKYFSFNYNIEINNQNTIIDPISVIFTNSSSQYDYSYVLSNTLFIDSSPNPNESIKEYIEKNDLYFAIGKSNNLYDEYVKWLELSTQKCVTNIFVSVVSLLVNFIIIFCIFSSYYEKNKFKIAVKEIFGYNKYSIYKYFILLNIILNIFAFILYFIKGESKILPYSFLATLILDIIYFYLIIKFMGRKEVTLVLKEDK